MFLNSREKYLPMLVNMRAEGLMSEVAAVEQETGLSLDIDDIIEEIVSCLFNEPTAKVELEMYGLDLMNKHCNTCNEEDAEKIIKLFINLGTHILTELIRFGLYRNQRLRFMFNKRVLDNLTFLEVNSDTVRILNDDLDKIDDRFRGMVRLHR